MNELKLIDYSEKIKQLIKIVKNKRIKQSEADDILFFIANMIDEVILKDSTISHRLNINLIKNNRILDIDIKPSKKVVSTKDTHEFLYLLKTLLSLMTIKNYFFDFYIYSEIKMIVNYYINKSSKSKSYDSVNERFAINELEFHDQLVMYKYLYSIFDKLMFINVFFVDKYNLKSIDVKSNFIFTKDFDSVSMPLFKTTVRKLAFADYLKILNKSVSFHYIRKLRNNLEHSFTDPKSKYNIALETELLFVLVARTLIQMHRDLKNDDELLKLIKLNQVNK
ncbi:unknown protein [Mesoplasma florum L1]|uniref:Uncharacterized protein n=1 Tax=Mesoplasma florum (strain ATCC 33453 / NBRC 100688 / NCTC 11704 / L1) TaxID=265311 RepID=Q6F0R4_MESFL|nr:hypothetical protein [Mesoplasma florum]AAT75909.1 unknown protein [Mesoplasma florum L1]ATI73516.1 hypothetical protein CQZ69_03065 [Mesoplasma florum]AVN61214.1 hypothetical protein CG005_02925 [Mesoplasma florum]AVN61909.1 hypothetical protein CG004_03050 [Mesoplasma florum]